MCHHICVRRLRSSLDNQSAQHGEETQASEVLRGPSEILLNEDHSDTITGLNLTRTFL